MGHNKQISEELPISFHKKKLKFIKQFIFIIQRDALLMYDKFGYKFQKYPLITFTRWMP